MFKSNMNTRHYMTKNIIDAFNTWFTLSTGMYIINVDLFKFTRHKVSIHFILNVPAWGAFQAERYDVRGKFEGGVKHQDVYGP